MTTGKRKIGGGEIQYTAVDESKKARKIRSNGEDSLQSLVEAAKGQDLKFIFVGGKGGVGKTTSSSAIATLLATTCNKRVLLVSTDPAHSLGDAWRTTFSNAPSSPMKNLDVMELNPSEMMESELATWVEYANEFTNSGAGSEDSSILSKIESFQQWLAGVPGIDEAIALSAAITHIESGKYDMIVFDTAPTGHTLKLLALPGILEQGIEKLQSWQTTLWGYWDAFKGLTSGGGTAQATKKTSIRNEISQKMVNYKQNIQKVAKMLQDQNRARFIVVCIAEFLSVSETQRLLQELAKNKVRVSHIIVNQLVLDGTLSREDLTALESLFDTMPHSDAMNSNLMGRTMHTLRLTCARKSIQEKYLKVLRNFEETSKDNIEGICEVPLLPEEVTGADAIQNFVNLLVNDSDALVPKAGDPNLIGSQSKVLDDSSTEVTQKVHATKPKQENVGKGTSMPDSSGNVDSNISSRYASSSSTSTNTNSSSSSSGSSSSSSTATATATTNSFMTKAMHILEDPEIKAMIAQEPLLKAAIEDCLQNPMNITKYFMDPKLSPFISKAVSKFRG